MEINEVILIMDGATRNEHLYMYDAEDRPYLIARAESTAVRILKEIQTCQEIKTVSDVKELLEEMRAIKAYIEPLRSFNTNNEHLEKIKEIIRKKSD